VTGYTIPFGRLGIADVGTVGGKNASLGEMIARLGQAGVRVPDGFATTAQAYRDFLAQGDLGSRIGALLAGLDVDDVVRLAETGARIRGWILETPLQPRLRLEVQAACEALARLVILQQHCHLVQPPHLRINVFTQQANVVQPLAALRDVSRERRPVFRWLH